ncbi:MAG TPA: S-layer homology domain-containing protein [Firmicutes bacterium]|nr:S-layer homology domain-containing protein [Bacillota bacterium]
MVKAFGRLLSFLGPATLTIFIVTAGITAGISTEGPGLLHVNSIAAAQTHLKDIEYSWARDAIEPLVEEGIISGYPDGTFKPEATITRAEFAKIVARAFAIRSGGQQAFKDVKDGWAKAYITALADHGIVSGYPDGTFRPKKNITRAEMVTMLMRVIKLADKMDRPTPWEPSFTDVQPGYWAFRYIETANRLGILPVHYGVVFEPNVDTTRAETAWMVKSLIDLKTIEGKVASVDAQQNTITVQKANEMDEIVALDPGTEVYRNSVYTEAGKLLRGDDVYIVCTSYGEPKFVKAKGIVTKDDIAAKVSILTKGTLTPAQVEALAEGRWGSVKKDLTPALRDRLVGYGLTPEEADGLLAQDWTKLTDLAKQRLARAVSEELGISAELATALLNQDWQQAKTYGQIEAAQYLLAKLMNM